MHKLQKMEVILKNRIKINSLVHLLQGDKIHILSLAIHIYFNINRMIFTAFE